MAKSKYKQKLEYNNEYNRLNYRSFSVRFNMWSEQEIISWLESQESVKQYLTQLIENDMKKAKKKKTTNKK
ncbi:MAG: hypothetical protein IJ875_06945 [Solobacterium sp.]|nr:hypothetical protein [Solobacterium sp.]